MYRGRGRYSGSAGGLLFTLAIHFLSQYAGSDRKPPVTAALIAANVIMFLRPGRLDDILPTISDVCLNPHAVLKDWDMKRIFLSAFYHLDETHLVYNMLSLLWKGVQLENNMGSVKFAEMVAVLLGLSHGLVVVLAKGLNTFFDYPDALFSHCAIGFSAVLFALKVVLNWNSPNYTDVYGVLVPARYAAWAELILIQMFVPGTSFLGHLCGILAGILYVRNSNWLTLSGIISSVINRILHLRNQLASLRNRLIWWLPFLRGRTLGRSRTPRDPRSGRAMNNNLPEGSRAIHDRAASTVWRCQMCTYDNSIYLDTCEMCGTPFREGTSNDMPPPSAPPLHPELSLDEIRQRRLARFNR